MDREVILSLGILVAYGYIFVLSLHGAVVQEVAAEKPHDRHHHGHGPERHLEEVSLHLSVAVVVFLSLVVRLRQLSREDLF